MILLWCMMLIAAIGLVLSYDKPRAVLARPFTGRAIEPPPKSATADLSVPSKELYREYMELPEASRPFPDIISVLKGLDAATAHNVQGRNDHYDGHYYMRAAGYSSSTWQKMKFSWEPDFGPCASARYYGRHCEFHIYRDLHDEIVKVKKELAATERALSVAQNAHHVDNARELMQHLRDEAKIQREVRELNS